MHHPCLRTLLLVVTAILFTTHAFAALDESILSGDYYSAFYETKSAEVVRVFALKFDGDFNRRTVDEAARRACRVLEWKRLTLGPRGLLDQRLTTPGMNYVVGVSIPCRKSCKWVAIGHEAPDHLFTIRTNGDWNDSMHHPESRGWEFEESTKTWKARIEESGWHREPVRDGIVLGIGLLADRSITYTFQVDGAYVRLAGDREDYQRDIISPGQLLAGSGDSPHRFYGLEVNGDPVTEAGLRRAVDFGLDHVRGYGLTLGPDPGMPSGKMFSATLPENATLILATYHPTRDKNTWLALGLDRATNRLSLKSNHGFQATADPGRFVTASGGRRVELRLFTDALPHVGFLFLEPQSAYGDVGLRLLDAPSTAGTPGALVLPMNGATPVEMAPTEATERWGLPLVGPPAGHSPFGLPISSSLSPNRTAADAAPGPAAADSLAPLEPPDRPIP